MIFKIKTISAAIFSLAFSFTTAIWALESGIPLPSGAVKLLERSSNFGPIKSSAEIYKSPLAKNQVLSFYKKEMPKAGWKEKQENVFIKDKYIAIIDCDSSKNKQGGIEFCITMSNIPAKKDFLAMRKANPDKLIFMPIYPASEQLFILDLPGGMASAYETERSVEDVDFFYKSGMLNYGWSLDYEQVTPLHSGAFDNLSKSNLTFRKPNGETCTIRISSIFVASGDQAASDKAGDINKPKVSSKTTIFVNYYEHKSIKK